MSVDTDVPTTSVIGLTRVDGQKIQIDNDTARGDNTYEMTSKTSKIVTSTLSIGIFHSSFSADAEMRTSDVDTYVTATTVPHNTFVNIWNIRFAD